MKHIALGILTYNHPKIVKEILSVSRQTYTIFSAYGFDIYYLDSGETEETQRIVEAEIANGFANLHYVRISPDTSPAKKLQYFLMGKYCDEEYSYYWPAKDRVFFDLPNLMSVYSFAITGKYDLILLDGYGKDKGVKAESCDYNSPELFYNDFGWEAPSLDVTLYSKKLLSIYDWSENEYDKSMPLYYFLQIDVIFNGLSMIKNPQIRLIRDDNTVIYNHTGIGSMWINETFLIWKDHWIDINNSLPSIYDPYKDHVIRGHALPDLLKSENGFRELYRQGVLTKDNLRESLERLEQVTDVSKELIISIVNGN